MAECALLSYLEVVVPKNDEPENRMCSLRILVVAGSLLLTVAHALDSFVFGSFIKSATYSVAVQNALFEEQGLNVSYSQIPNSTFGYAALLAGQYDLLLGAIDNVLNRRWNSGQPLSVIGQQDQGPDFVLQSVPNITSISQLKGKPLMVDSPVSGYAYALQRILALNGLSLAAGDYFFTTVGGGNLRYAALLNGTYNGSAVYATMMTAPFTAYGRALTTSNKPNILTAASDYVYPYPSNAFTVTTNATSSLQTRSKIVRFLTAMLKANQFLSHRENMNASVAAIAKTLNISQRLATAEYTVLTDPLTGETTSAQAANGGFQVNRQGVWNVIGTRVEFNGWNANISHGFNFTDAIVPSRGGVFDYTLRDEAVGRVARS